MNFTTYEEELKLQPANRDSSSNFENFKRVFGFFLMNLTSMHRWNHLKVFINELFMEFNFVMVYGYDTFYRPNVK